MRILLDESLPHDLAALILDHHVSTVRDEGWTSVKNGKLLALASTKFDAFITAFNALDWESFRACFADDASLFNPDIPGAISLHRLDGRSEIERSFRVVFGSPPAGSAKSGPNIVPDNIRIQRFGETAILTFEFKRPNHSFGRRTIIMNRRSGDWRIVHIHASNVTE